MLAPTPSTASSASTDLPDENLLARPIMHPSPTLEAVLHELRKDWMLLVAAMRYLEVPAGDIEALAVHEDRWNRAADRIAFERRSQWLPVHSDAVVHTVLSACGCIGRAADPGHAVEQRHTQRHNVLMAMRSAGVGETDIGLMLNLEHGQPAIESTPLLRLLADRIALALEETGRPVTRQEVTRLRTEGEFATLCPEPVVPGRRRRPAARRGEARRQARSATAKPVAATADRDVNLDTYLPGKVLAGSGPDTPSL